MSGKIYQTVEESRLNEMHRALFISDKSYNVPIMALVSGQLIGFWILVFSILFSESILGYFPKAKYWKAKHT